MTYPMHRAADPLSQNLTQTLIIHMTRKESPTDKGTQGLVAHGKGRCCKLNKENTKNLLRAAISVVSRRVYVSVQVTR